MIKIFKSTCFLILSHSFQFQKVKKFGGSSVNMVDFKKFDSIDVEGESIETSLISNLVSEIQPIGKAFEIIKSGDYKVISVGEASHGTEVSLNFVSSCNIFITRNEF